MWKWIAVIFVIIIFTQCTKFGDDNSYTCHCINEDEQCNRETGVCSGDCATGWYGTTCQKQNVALGKPSSQIDVLGIRNSSLAVDGNRTTTVPDKCSDTMGGKPGSWWRVDLIEEFPINHIIIYYRNERTDIPRSLNGFSLHVNKENQEPQLCYTDYTTALFPPAKRPINCSQTITGRYVNISNLHTDRNYRFFTLCEVEIYVCSVGTFGSDCTNFCHCLNNTRCSETGQCPEGCADGWKGTTCSQKCADGFYGDGCQKICGDRKCLNNLSCDRVRGQCIGGCSDGYILTDCFQACDNDTYGAGCVKNCTERNCLIETSPCNHISGSCEGDCKDGFKGSACVKGCEEGVYGAGCSKKCSDRHCLVETSSCNHINGSCEGDCKEGFSGSECDKGCEEGVYGAGCSKKCSDRKCKDSNLQCDSVTGACIDLCQSGYQSIDCTQECDDGTYGQECQFKCSARFCQPQDKVTCSNIDGACDCLEGYEGKDCTVKKSAGDNTGATDQSSTIIGTILGLLFGFVAGAIVVLFIMKRRLRSQANKSQKITSNQSGNNITQQETAIDQPVTQPSSNVNQDNPYGQLTTIYQNEHAYEHLGQI